MKYKEILFKISAPAELSEAAADVVAALAAEAGLEAFESVEEDDAVGGITNEVASDSDSISDAAIVAAAIVDETVSTADGVAGEATTDAISGKSDNGAKYISGGTNEASLLNAVSLLKGYAREDLFDTSALETLVSDFPIEGVSVSFTVGDADDRDWNEAWEKKGYEPVVVNDKLCVHDLLHFPARAYDIDIAIDAKQAFGTGTHDTTQMILQHLLNINIEGCRFLDCGCGTGILSIAALKMGAASAAAYDIDEWSSDNTRHNADINGVGERLTVVCGDASAIPGLCSAVGPFDIVVANINRNILLADLPAFAEAMKKPAEKNKVSVFGEEKAEVSPGKSEINQEIEVSQEEAEVNPVKVEVSPEKIEIIQEETEVSPEKVEVSQEETEVSHKSYENGIKSFGASQLVLSGFYDADIPLLEEKAASLGLHKISEYHSGEWACVVFQNG